MFTFLVKKWVITLAIITSIGGGSFGVYHFYWAQPSANCPQPPRTGDPETLTPQQRTYYGYPPAGLGKNTPAWDKEYQLHGTHVCGGGPIFGAQRSPGISIPPITTPTKSP